LIRSSSWCGRGVGFGGGRVEAASDASVAPWRDFTGGAEVEVEVEVGAWELSPPW